MLYVKQITKFSNYVLEYNNRGSVHGVGVWSLKFDRQQLRHILELLLRKLELGKYCLLQLQQT